MIVAQMTLNIISNLIAKFRGNSVYTYAIIYFWADNKGMKS